LDEIQAALPADAALITWIDIAPAGPGAAEPSPPRIRMTQLSTVVRAPIPKSTRFLGASLDPIEPKSIFQNWSPTFSTTRNHPPALVGRGMIGNHKLTQRRRAPPRRAGLVSGGDALEVVPLGLRPCSPPGGPLS
jgi:hypothetical protein